MLANGQPSKAFETHPDGIRLGCSFVTTAVVQLIADVAKERGLIK